MKDEIIGKNERICALKAKTYTYLTERNNVDKKLEAQKRVS